MPGRATHAHADLYPCDGTRKSCRASTTETQVGIVQIDIDDQALAEAMRLTGSASIEDTVNTALRASAARLRRLEAADKLAERAARGEFVEAESAHAAAKVARRAMPR